PDHARVGEGRVEAPAWILRKPGDSCGQALEPPHIHPRIVLLHGLATMPDGRHADGVPAQCQLLAEQLHLALVATDEGRVEIASHQDTHCVVPLLWLITSEIWRLLD